MVHCVLETEFLPSHTELLGLTFLLKEELIMVAAYTLQAFL
jgi:hypothetical protein